MREIINNYIRKNGWELKAWRKANCKIKGVKWEITVATSDECECIIATYSARINELKVYYQLPITVINNLFKLIRKIEDLEENETKTKN